MDINFLQHWLWSAWEQITAYPTQKSNRTKNNRAIWQCAITALLVQKILWGEIIKADVSNYGFSHYRNQIDWQDIDFTASQFDSTPILANQKSVNEDEILSKEDTKQRFEILKANFDNFVIQNQTIENNISSCKKCNYTQHFEHSTIHFGKNCQLLLIGEAPAQNGWLVTGKAWVNKEWKILPSGKIMQKLLDIIDIHLFDITFLEGIKCFPQNRKILKNAMFNCKNILYDQINLLKPNILITLWNNPTKTFLWNTYNKFADVVWKTFDITIANNIYKLIPIYHPSPISPLSFKWNVPIFEKIKASKNWPNINF